MPAIVTPFGKRECVAGQKRMAETSALRHTPPISSRAGFGAAQVDKKNAADRAEDGNAAEDKRIDDRRRRRREGQGADQNRADQADRVGFENVRGHAGAIAHVIAHVVGDRGRIARVVFLEVAFDLAHQIGADVRGLGVNAAAESRENADQTRAQREADQTVHRSVVADHVARHAVKNADGEERQADHQQTGHGAAVESDAQRRRARLGRGLGGARIGQHRDAHADEAGGERANRADDETDRAGVILEEEQQNENDDRDRR